MVRVADPATTFEQEDVLVALTPHEVERLAELARIDLTPEELATLAPQLGVILDSVAAVSGVAGDDVPPTTHALPLQNVFRADEVRASLSPDQVLAGAPSTQDGRFRVPRILGEQQ